MLLAALGVILPLYHLSATEDCAEQSVFMEWIRGPEDIADTDLCDLRNDGHRKEAIALFVTIELLALAAAIADRHEDDVTT